MTLNNLGKTVVKIGGATTESMMFIRQKSRLQYRPKQILEYQFRSRIFVHFVTTINNSCYILRE
jgi:hypothetical protein